MALTEERRKQLDKLFGKTREVGEVGDIESRITRLRSIVEETKKEEPEIMETQERAPEIAPVGLEPALPTAPEVIKETGMGIVKGAAETITGIAKIPSQIGKFVAEKQLGLLGVDKEKIPEPFRRETRGVLERQTEEEIETKTPFEKFGKGLEFVGEFLFPTSIFGKAAKIKAIDAVTPIEKGVQTVLKKSTSKNLNKFADQAKKAIADPALPSPMDIAGDTAKKALDRLGAIRKELGTSKEAITKEIGKRNLGRNVTIVRNKMNKLLSERTGVKIVDGEIKTIRGRVAKITDATDIKLLNDVNKRLVAIEKNPTFRKVDDTIDAIQDLLFKRKSLTATPVNTRVSGILKEVTGDLNNRLKKVSEGTKFEDINKELSSVIEVHKRLNKLLGESANKGGSVMKRVFSQTDSGTKKMFAKIKDITGVDLVEDAILAKFSMDVVGDTRQMSLLKANLSGKGSIVRDIAERGIRFFSRPFEKAKRIVEKAERLRK